MSNTARPSREIEGKGRTVRELLAGRTEAPRQFKPYPSYEDSGVEWLGETPAGWKAKRLRFVSESNPVPSEVRGLPGETEVSFVPMEAVGEHGGLSLETTKQLADVKAGYTYFRDGDIVIAKITPCFENGKGALAAGLTNGIAFGTTELHVLRTTDAADRRFMFYVTLSDAFRRLGEADMYGAGGQKRVSESFVRNFSHALPSLSEQRAIAAFLDRQTERIQALVAKKERLIELLREQRTALITRAVTKGLDPNVPLKDSGVEWLGEIPVHWEVNRTKFAARLRSGHTPSRQHPEYWQDCTIPWFGLADVWQIRDGQIEYVYETAEKISELGLANSAARLLPKGTVILSRTASVGFAAILGVDMATTQDFVNWVCGPTLRPEFLLYVFRSMAHEFRRLTMGSTHQTIYMPDVGGFSTPILPVPEQDRIVAVIRKETARIDTLVTKVRDAIDRLKELRTALISAAVTGKIDVREEVA
jgi:type I restriction enzyme S subunit